MLFAVFVGARFALAGLRVLRRRANLFHFPQSGRNLKSSKLDTDTTGADTPFLPIWSGASSPQSHLRRNYRVFGVKLRVIFPQIDLFHRKSGAFGFQADDAVQKHGY